MKFFGREPAVFLGVIASAIALLVATGVIDWSEGQTEALLVALGALVAIGTAYFTKDITLGVLVGAAEAIIAALLAFGIELDPETTAAIMGIISTLFAFFQRTQTTPATGFNTE